MKKNIIAISLASGVTFGLFALMALLVEQESSRVEDDKKPIIVDVIQTPAITKANKIVRMKPIPPVLPKPAPSPDLPPESREVKNEFVYQQVGMDLVDKGIGLKTLEHMPNSDARPIVRVNPRYPIDAARDGIEGWVVLSFDIDEIGSVTNVKVLDSKPKRIFDKQARLALRKWKYRAKAVDGKVVMQKNMSVRLDFKMDQQQG